MRILMLNPFYPPYEGGTEKHVHEVSKRLAKNHDVTVLTARLPNTKKEETVDGVCVCRTDAFVLEDLPGPLPPPIPVMPHHSRELRRLLAENDCLHAHNRFFYGLDLVAASKKAKKPLFITLHNARPKGIGLSADFWGQAFDDTIGAAVMNAAKGILGVSQYTLDVTVPKKFNGPKAVAYNGVNSAVFRPQGKKREKTVLCVARLVPQKGLRFLVDAMANVDARLTIVGRGPLEKSLRQRAKEGKIDAELITETLPEKELARRYANAGVFCLPSLWEPFGMVVAEAMAAGTPVVSTKVGGIPEIVRNGKDGFLVPPRDARALAEKISAVLYGPKTASRMAASGRARAASTFTWDNTAKAYERFYTHAGQDNEYRT